MAQPALLVDQIIFEAGGTLSKDADGSILSNKPIKIATGTDALPLISLQRTSGNANLLKLDNDNNSLTAAVLDIQSSADSAACVAVGSELQIMRRSFLGMIRADLTTGNGNALIKATCGDYWRWVQIAGRVDGVGPVGFLMDFNTKTAAQIGGTRGIAITNYQSDALYGMPVYVTRSDSGGTNEEPCAHFEGGKNVLETLIKHSNSVGLRVETQSIGNFKGVHVSDNTQSYGNLLHLQNQTPAAGSAAVLLIDSIQRGGPVIDLNHVPITDQIASQPALFDFSCVYTPTALYEYKNWTGTMMNLVLDFDDTLATTGTLQGKAIHIQTGTGANEGSDANLFNITRFKGDGHLINLDQRSAVGDFLYCANNGTKKALIDKDGNAEFVGEASVKVFAQDAEPTLAADNFFALWKDTNDSNRMYLLFRRGSGDHVKIELT